VILLSVYAPCILPFGICRVKSVRNSEGAGITGGLQFFEVDDAAVKRNCYGMRPISGAKFAQNILDVDLDCAEHCAQLVADVFVTEALRHEAKHLHFARCERHMGRTIAQVFGNLRQRQPLP